jgi:hypothetical protein
MSDYVIGLAVLVLILLIPQTRRSAMEILGVSLIAAVSLAVIGLPVWALYRVEPLLEAPAPPPVVAADNGTGQLNALLRQQEEDERRRVEDERRRQEEEQRKREEELARIAGILENLRAIVERERNYAEIVVSSPRLPGVGGISVDLIGIRIPGWRDSETAEREKAVIRAWLHSIGLSPEESASIHTANGWGSVYDIWRAENPPAVDAPSEEGSAEVASVPEDAPPAEPEPEQEPVPDLPPAPELRQQEAERKALAERRAEQRAAARRAEARRQATPPRRPPPARRPPPPPEPQVGPFGF